MTVLRVLVGSSRTCSLAWTTFAAIPSNMESSDDPSWDRTTTWESSRLLPLKMAADTTAFCPFAVYAISAQPFLATSDFDAVSDDVGMNDDQLASRLLTLSPWRELFFLRLSGLSILRVASAWFHLHWNLVNDVERRTKSCNLALFSKPQQDLIAKRINSCKPSTKTTSKTYSPQRPPRRSAFFWRAPVWAVWNLLDAWKMHHVRVCFSD